MRCFNEGHMKKAAAMLLVGCLVATWTGCGGKSDGYRYSVADTASAEMNTSASFDVGGSYVTEEAAAGTEMKEVEESTVEVNDNAANTQSERKLIKTVDLNVETKEFDKMMTALTEQVDVLGGYIENMETYNGSSYASYRNTRNANMTIRIPKNHLDGFLETVSGIGNVVRKSEYVEDVTLAYVDLESHKNALRTEQTRLLELLENAGSMEDIIVIEQRLSEVRYELESMESQLRTYDNKVDYSTVYLNVNEVKELTPVVEETVWERMLNGFMSSLSDIGEDAREFGIWFVVHIPYMVIWAVIIVIIVAVHKKLRKNRRARKAKKAALKNAAEAVAQQINDVPQKEEVKK